VYSTKNPALSLKLEYGLEAFLPLFTNPHLATIAGNFWPRTLDTGTYPVRARFFLTEPNVQILVHSQAPVHTPKADLLMVHGLEGSSDAGYARSLSQAALVRGYAVHRFNMRSCGGTELVCGKTLYHSGQTSDLLAVAREIFQENGQPVILIGFSLGGNVVLKLAGELGHEGDGARPLLAGVISVSAPIDLAACARQLAHRENFIYERRFVDRLKKRIRLKERLTPGSFPLERLARVSSVYEFDDAFTAPSFGFGTADNYYATQSSNQFLEHIRIPALVIQAQDDPLIPFSVYRHPAFDTNPCLTLLAPQHGGHLGFVSRTSPRFWLDGVLPEWIGSKLREHDTLGDKWTKDYRN
jgi:predicted alpha/beta-fold hydrolase